MKNSKIISAVLAAAVGGMMFTGTIPVLAEGEYHTIVIRPENFFEGEGSSAVTEGTQWTVSGTNALNTSTNRYTINNETSSEGKPAEASIPIYIEEAGSYRMFVLMRDLNDNNQVRLFSAGIDDQYEYFGAKLGLKDNSSLLNQVPDNYMKYVAPLPAGVTLNAVGYYWDGASHDYTDVSDEELQLVDGEPSKYDHELFELERGMHTFKLRNEYPAYRNGRIAAVLLTDDPSFNELDNYSVPSYEGQPAIFKEALDTLSDIRAPVFSEELFAGEIREDSVTVNWNTDDTDIVCVEVSCGDMSELIEYDGTNSYTFTGLNEATQYNLGVKIMDSLGQYAYSEISVVTEGNADDEPPEFTGPLTAVNDGPGKISLSWNEAHDNIGIAKYIIYLDDINERVKEVSASVLSTSINASRGQHTVYVRAADNAGNLSDPIYAEVSVQGVTNIMLRPDNFTYNETEKGWKSSREDRILFGDRTVLGKENSDSETARARVYLEKGRYRMMAYVLDPIASPGSRPFSIRFDGVSADYEFAKKGITTQSNAAQTAFYDYWDTGFVFESDYTGLHDIEIYTSAANVKLYGILITSDESLGVSGLTAEVAAEYEDITPPQTPLWSIKADSLNGAYVDIDGDGTVYVITDNQGNEIKMLESSEGTIDEISALKSYEYGITAYDTHGNTANGDTKSFYMSPVNTEWSIENTDKGVKLNYSLTGNSISDFECTLIFAVYDTEGSCIDYIEKAFTIDGSGTQTGELELDSASFETAIAMLWDNTEDMHPLAFALEYEE